MSILRDVQARQGMPTPQNEADWQKYREAKATRRAQNVVNAREVLDRNGVEYVEGKDADDLVQFTIQELGRDPVCYHPEEGRWFNMVDKRIRFGVRNLVKHLKGELK